MFIVCRNLFGFLMTFQGIYKVTFFFFIIKFLILVLGNLFFLHWSIGPSKNYKVLFFADKYFAPILKLSLHRVVIHRKNSHFRSLHVHFYISKPRTDFSEAWLISGKIIIENPHDSIFLSKTLWNLFYCVHGHVLDFSPFDVKVFKIEDFLARWVDKHFRLSLKNIPTHPVPRR